MDVSITTHIDYLRDDRIINGCKYVSASNGGNVTSKLETFTPHIDYPLVIISTTHDPPPITRVFAAHAPDRPSIICAAARSDGPKDRRMWRDA